MYILHQYEAVKWASSRVIDTKIPFIIKPLITHFDDQSNFVRFYYTEKFQSSPSSNYF